MSGRTTVVLAAPPSLGSLYSRAAGAKIRALLPGHQPVPGTLIPVEHRLDSLPVDTDRLAAYHRMMGDTLRDELPSVFMHGLVFPLALSVMVRDDFPLPLLGMVHLANHVTHRRAINPRAALRGVAYAQDLRGHRVGTQLDVVVEVFDGSSMVWRGTSTYLARGIFLAQDPVGGQDERVKFIPPSRTASWQLGAGTGREYAAVLGDYNPIHLSGPSAKALGMKKAIAHGMYLAGRMLAGTAPHDAGYDWEINFSTPVFLPSTVDVAVQERGSETVFSGWGARSSKPHFNGSITAHGPQ